jgi:hypothetical protein
LCEGIRLANDCAWSAALEQLDAAIATASTDGRESCEETVLARLHRFDVLVRRGSFLQLTDELGSLGNDAEAGGDTVCACLFRTGEPVLAWLARGDVLRVRRDLELARALAPAGGRWPVLSSRIAIADSLLLLYEQRPVEARDRLARDWDQIVDRGAFGTPADEALAWWLRGRAIAGVAGLERGSVSRTDGRRKELLADAASCSKALRSSRYRAAEAFAFHVESAVERALSNDDRAWSLAQRAAAGFDEWGMLAHGAAIRCGAEDPVVRSAAKTTLHDLGVRNVTRFAELLGG